MSIGSDRLEVTTANTMFNVAGDPGEERPAAAAAVRACYHF